MSPELSAEAEAERRQVLLEAARHVFAERGYDGATVAAIVKRAGVAQGTFYLYFESKQAVFLALAEGFFEAMAAHVGEAVAAELELERRIDRLVAACFAAARENPDLVRLVFFGAESASAEIQARLAAGNAVSDALEAMLAADLKAGTIAAIDPPITARLLIGLVRNAVLEAFVLGDGSDAERLERATSRIFLNALGARP